MIVKVFPSTINGSQVAPASKSSMQRACAAALLHNGITHIHNAGISNDDKAALDIIQQLGASIVTNGKIIEIYSKGFWKNTLTESKLINCGESGLAIRMFAPIAALASHTIHINGKGTLLTRPMDFFDEIFPQLGVEIFSNNGNLPLKIKGPLQTFDISIDGSLSSQFLTGLLFAFGEAATEQVCITVNNLKSKPYIDLTLHVMQHFGFEINHLNHEKFYISKKRSENIPINYTVEGDWSSASFLLVAAAIAGQVRLSGIDLQSTQADKAIMNALESCGAKIKIDDDNIEITKAELNAFEFDATDCPDLFPPLVALAAYCNGTSIIKGSSRLAAKESDRALTLKDIYNKMGIEIILEKDIMKVVGGKIKAAKVSSHHDHRIAMSAAVAAIGADGAIEIEGADAINKSYPKFFEDMKKFGVKVERASSNSPKGGELP